MTQPPGPDRPEDQRPDPSQTTPLPPFHQPSTRQPPEQTTAAPGAAAPTATRSTGWFSGSRRTAIVTGVAGLVVGGVIGGSIGWAATGNDDTSHTTSAYSQQMSPGERQGSGSAGQTKRRTRGAVAGTITAIDGSSWTISGRGGRTLTVTIGPNTTFGTKKVPAKQSDFAVGDRVAVIGKESGGNGSSATIDATRVAKRTAPAAASTTPATPGATSQPS